MNCIEVTGGSRHCYRHLCPEIDPTTSEASRAYEFDVFDALLLTSFKASVTEQ